MITVVALMSKGILDSSLKSHLINAKKNGITKEEMAEIITHVAFYAGWPNAWAVFRLLSMLDGQMLGLCSVWQKKFTRMSNNL